MEKSNIDHLQTAGAALAAFILVIPATALVSLGWRLSGVPVPSDELSSVWLPYPIDLIVVRWIGSALLGTLAGAFSMMGASAIFRKASPELASYAASAVWIVVTLILVVLSGIQKGDFLGRGPTMLQGIGYVVGIVAVAFGRSSRRA